jgi:serine/threonine-protein kinase
MFPRELPLALQGFDILQRLGVGGAGEVFLARSRGGRLVAIKTIADAGAGSSPEGETTNALAREASVCVRLTHPCIVQVRAFLDEPGFAALVFEYIPGVALGRVLRFCQGHGVRLPDRAAWHIVERVLVALAYAHAFTDENGQPTPIVHRDISPSNVLLDWTGGVKIADFGIAKVLGLSTSATRLGIVKGTLGCMAPEQARGEPVDERADVYAAALLAWRLATGRVPFAKQQADEFELLRAMRNPRIKPLAVLRPDLPEPLLDAVARALEPEPAQRTIGAADLATVVREHVDVRAGWLELSGLLDGWKGALERTVKRSPSFTSASERTPASGSPVESTLRYEEVALAFDEEPAQDSPTFQAHALPSDPRALAALPLAEDPNPSGTAAVAPPFDPASLGAWREAEVAKQAPLPQPAAEARELAPTRRPSARVPAWAPLVAIAILLAAGLLVGLLASVAR